MSTDAATYAAIASEQANSACAYASSAATFAASATTQANAAAASAAVASALEAGMVDNAASLAAQVASLAPLLGGAPAAALTATTQAANALSSAGLALTYSSNAAVSASLAAGYASSAETSVVAQVAAETARAMAAENFLTNLSNSVAGTSSGQFTTVVAGGNDGGSYTGGVQIGGGVGGLWGNAGSLLRLDGHATWLSFHPTEYANPATVEFAVNASTAVGQASAAAGTNVLTWIQGFALSNIWIGHKIYFNYTVLKVVSVSGTTLTVSNTDGSAYTFPANVTEVFYVGYVVGSGLCNVSGTTVTHVSGDPFVPYAGNPNFIFKINGTARTCTAFTSSTLVFVSDNLGVLTNVPYYFALDINDELSTFRIQKTALDVENFSAYCRYDGTWLENQYGGFGKYREMRLTTGELSYSPGTKSQQIVLQKGGDLTLGGDYGWAAIRILAPALQPTSFLAIQAPNGTYNPAIMARSDTRTDVGLAFDTKGAGEFAFTTGNFGAFQFKITHTPSSVNYLAITGNVAAAPPVLFAMGSDADIDILFYPKGTGLVRIGTAWTPATSSAVDGYMTIKDSSGTIRKIATLA